MDSFPIPVTRAIVYCFVHFYFTRLCLSNGSLSTYDLLMVGKSHITYILIHFRSLMLICKIISCHSQNYTTRLKKHLNVFQLQSICNSFWRHNRKPPWPHTTTSICYFNRNLNYVSLLIDIHVLSQGPFKQNV